MKKKLSLVIIVIFVLILSGCEGFVLPTDVILPTDVTIPTSIETTNDGTNTENTFTTEPQTTEPQTTEPHTTEPHTTDNITAIINDEIYLELNAGQDTVEINDEWIDAGALFVLNDESYEMITEDTVDITTLGLYEIEYTYTYEEETYSIIRYVIVVDQTAPDMELNLGVDTIKVGDTWTDAGVTITDNSEEEISSVVSGEVDNTTTGTYTITYTAIDSSGNETELIRVVTVIE